jgi:L-fuconolactonase
VLRLAKLSNVTLKVSALQYSSREAWPHRDLRPFARRAFDSFGPDRMMWGSLGTDMNAFKQRSEVFDVNFDFLSERDRSKIRAHTAARYFGFA